MAKLNDVLKAAQGVYDDLVTLQDLAKQAIDEADKRQGVLDARETKIQGIESAQVVLAEAKKLKDQAEQARIDLSTDRDAFENHKVQELKAIAVERDALLPLRDLKIELQQDRIKLEEEKRTYRETVKKELIEHFKNTSGKG